MSGIVVKQACKCCGSQEYLESSALCDYCDGKPNCDHGGRPVAQTDPPPPREWEASLRNGMLVPIAGWWFKVTGVVRQQQPLGALVLEPTGEKTGPKKGKRNVQALRPSRG